MRTLRRSPAFALTAIAILAIGIGMSVAMLTIVQAVLVEPLPVRDQDRVAVLWTYREPTTDYTYSIRELGEVRRRATTMSDVAGVAHWGATPTPLLDGDRTLSLNSGLVTDNFFTLLGTRPVLGHLFRVGEDDQPLAPLTGRPPPLHVVLAYRAWRRDFHGDSAIVGRRLVEPLLQQEYVVIGVAAPGLDYPIGVDAWMPAHGGWQSGNSTFALVRLAPGATLGAARDEYRTLWNRVEPNLRATGVHAQTLGETIVGNVRPAIILLACAVGLLLLISCINVGSLQLLRASGRTRELRLRRALGASYGDIMRQMLVEAAMLGLSGGGLGVGVALLALRAAASISQKTLPRLDGLALSHTPAIATVAVTLTAVVLFGVLPALLATRTATGASLRVDAHTGSETRTRRHLRNTLVGAQMALAMVTLGGAALLAASLARLERQDPGYTSEHLAYLGITWDVTQANTAPALTELAERIQSEIDRVPGVVAATPVVIPPLLGTGVWQLRLDNEHQTPEQAMANPAFAGDVVGPRFLETLGMRLVRGRSFTPDDRATSPLVMIVSESVARRLWPGQNPIGQRVVLPEASFAGGRGVRTVVGVVRDTRLRDIHEATGTVYLPVTQGYWQGSFAIRTTVPLETLEPALRQAIRGAGERAELRRVDAMSNLLDVPLGTPRLNALLMSVFGLVALALSAIGLYGTMASLVREQTRDIGIRMALGATPSRVRGEVLGRAGMIVGVGAIVGLVGVLLASRLMASLLYDVSPTDPATLGAALSVLIFAGLFATYLPARRATKVDPATALRSDA